MKYITSARTNTIFSTENIQTVNFSKDNPNGRNKYTHYYININYVNGEKLTLHFCAAEGDADELEYKAICHELRQSLTDEKK